MSETDFDFISGNLSLDFSNTNDWHARSNPIETMLNYSDLIAWGKQAGLLSGAQAEQIQQLESTAPVQAQHVYEQAIQLREAIYRIFSHRYAGTPVPEQDLRLLTAFVREAMEHLVLVPSESGFVWSWSTQAGGAKLILWSVARAAAELLTSEHVERVRECEDDHGCGYLFIDQTKNHSRRWCSMESCGNRAKARRHYARAQSAA